MEESPSADPSNTETNAILTRRSILRNAAGMSALSLGAGLLGGTPADAYERRVSSAKTSFALAVLPDTQFYSRYATDAGGNEFQKMYGSTPYPAQTQFIVDNASRYNIPFVIHLGDIVDQSSKWEQWYVADLAMQRLENARIPYSLCAGNHDVLSSSEFNGPNDQWWGTDAQRQNWNEPYLKWFPTSRAARQSTFLGRHWSGWHEAHAFTVFGVRFMVLSLSWRVSDDAIGWARWMIEQNPTLPVILVNHQLLNIDKDGVSPLEVPYGLMLWNKLIHDNDQIFMTLNGHYHGAAHLQKINDFGNPVEEMVVDYQMAYQGGNALMRLYEFDFTSNKIDVVSFSPWVVQKPRDKLNHFDRAWLTEDNQQFSIPMNFKTRFARFLNFAPTLATAGIQILPRLKQDLFANYAEPTPPSNTLPKDADDYPKVAETVAHWRVTDPVTTGTVVPAAGLLADVAGKNPMSRAAVDDATQLPDLVWSSDRHLLSSAPGSVRFFDGGNNGRSLSYFKTATNAPINAMTFPNGYTIEAFLKIDPQWTSDKNKWSNLLTRVGRRGALPGLGGGDLDSPTVQFAISNLREIQWDIIPSSATWSPGSNWSGEVMSDTWYHVAIVNDPYYWTTTMYIEGAPVLRNTGGSIGIATLGADKPWLIGCSTWYEFVSNGWFGHIGEIRIVSKPLGSESWLTARRT
ncbi:modulator protein [Methylobacterium sp. Leaf113]|nr:modulator protein [Methylobacterium sp. Leaf113]